MRVSVGACACAREGLWIVWCLRLPCLCVRERERERNERNRERESEYVWICVRACVCVWERVYVCERGSVHSFMSTSTLPVCVCVQGRERKRGGESEHVCIRVSICACVCVCVWMRERKSTHTLTHTYTPTHIGNAGVAMCVCVCVCVCACVCVCVFCVCVCVWLSQTVTLYLRLTSYHTTNPGLHNTHELYIRITNHHMIPHELYVWVTKSQNTRMSHIRARTICNCVSRTICNCVSRTITRPTQRCTTHMNNVYESRTIIRSPTNYELRTICMGLTNLPYDPPSVAAVAERTRTINMRHICATNESLTLYIRVLQISFVRPIYIVRDELWICAIYAPQMSH